MCCMTVTGLLCRVTSMILSEHGETPVPFPASTWEMDRAEPAYETLPRWQAPATGARSLSDLPENTRVNLERIEQLVGVPIALVSVGSRRSQIIRCW